MEIINVENFKEDRFETAIALGNFDGVHIGHQKLIKEMVENSKKFGLKSSVLLFNNHTKTVLEGKGPKLITSLKQKYDLIESLGVDIIYTMTFNENIMKLSPEEFVNGILIEKLNCKAVVVGTDYRFGHKASGNADLLRELGIRFNFLVNIVSPMYVDNEIVSSTKIRELITKGDLDMVKILLGRDYSLCGKVIHGKKMGTKLGFPTANIELLENYIVPKKGVYNTRTIIDNNKYLSATSVGYNPTFNEDILKIESHIIDFNENIYDKIVEIVFIKYLRDEFKFDTLDLLVEQMNKDIVTILSSQFTMHN